jgi:hypothetical protein
MNYAEYVNKGEKAVDAFRGLAVGIPKTPDDNDPICGTCGEAPTDCLCEETIQEEFEARGFTWDEEQCMFSGRLYDVVPTLPLRWLSSCVVYRIDSQTDKAWKTTNYDSITLLLEAWGKR